MPPVLANIDGITVDTAVIRAVARRMRVFYQDMYDSLYTARRRMAIMQTNAVWLSPAGMLIIEKMNALQPRIERQREVVAQFCDFLEHTAGAYEQAESGRLADAARA